MKRNILFLFAGIIIIPNLCLGNEGFGLKGFNDYVNSSTAPDVSTKNKLVDPSHALKDKPKENALGEDVPWVLQGILPKWKVCAADSDCTAVVADCVLWEPINKKYTHKILRNLNSCSASIDPGFQPVTVCVDRVCQATAKSTLVSWQEWLGKMKSLRKGN